MKSNNGMLILFTTANEIVDSLSIQALHLIGLSLEFMMFVTTRLLQLESKCGKCSKYEFAINHEKYTHAKYMCVCVIITSSL